METQGMEGAACDLASVSSLSDVDTSFRGQHVHVHTDSSDASIDTAGRYRSVKVYKVIRNANVEKKIRMKNPVKRH